MKWTWILQEESTAKLIISKYNLEIAGQKHNFKMNSSASKLSGWIRGQRDKLAPLKFIFSLNWTKIKLSLNLMYDFLCVYFPPCFLTCFSVFRQFACAQARVTRSRCACMRGASSGTRRLLLHMLRFEQCLRPELFDTAGGERKKKI